MPAASDSSVPADSRPSAVRTPGHIRLTSHSGGASAPAITWGAPTARERGPVIATTTDRAHRNVIGTHSGSFHADEVFALATHALDNFAELSLTRARWALGPLFVPRRGR